jgi:acylpyruvate hydrolase
MSYLTKIVPRNIICIGLNFAKHAAELGSKLPAKPMIFIKPVSSLLLAPYKIELPRGVDVHHESRIA